MDVRFTDEEQRQAAEELLRLERPFRTLIENMLQDKRDPHQIAAAVTNALADLVALLDLTQRGAFVLCLHQYVVAFQAAITRQVTERQKERESQIIKPS